jgi:hypothetical protein
LRAASCCKRDVMNGACAFLRRSFFSTFETVALPAASSSRISCASASVFGSAFSPFHLKMRAPKRRRLSSSGVIVPSGAWTHVVSTDQYS